MSQADIPNLDPKTVEISETLDRWHIHSCRIYYDPSIEDHRIKVKASKSSETGIIDDEVFTIDKRLKSELVANDPDAANSLYLLFKVFARELNPIMKQGDQLYWWAEALETESNLIPLENTSTAVGQYLINAYLDLEVIDSTIYYRKSEGEVIYEPDNEID